MSIVSTRIARGTLALRRRPILLAAAGGLLAGLVAFAGSQVIQALPDDVAASLVHPVRYQTVPRQTGNASVPRQIGDGLAENSWDFSAVDGVPGFGPLDPAAAGR